MVSRIASGLCAWRWRLALIPVLAVVALATAQSASASPLTGEALSGTGYTSNGSCSNGVSAKASFSASGQATGPYPGTFVATSGSASVSGHNFGFGNLYASESAKFTITSGATTITGSFNPRSSTAFGGYSCPTFSIGLLSFNYTAVINGHTYQGAGFAGGKPGLLSPGHFDTSPGGLATNVNINFTDFTPTVTTGSASGVGASYATVSAGVNPNGNATTYHFDYGTSTNYGSQAPAPPDPSAGSGTTTQTESTTLTGLSPNTVYHYRIEAANVVGASYGADQTFTTTATGTPPPAGNGPIPIVATGSAINVGTFGAGTATVTGTVNANGEAATYHFDYGTSTNYTSQTISEPISSTTAELVDAGLTGLSPNTVYHYRIEATDAWGTSYGADQTFTNP
jgi:hypothetical protein